MSKKPVLLAIVSDIHNGSTLAACPPEGVTLDDGGTYTPSTLQSWIWDNWCDYWAKIHSARKAAKADLWCVFNGDLFEGDHHHTSQIVSTNPESQAYLASRIFGVPVAFKPQHLFIVRGTEAHVGPSGASEEAFARKVHAEKNPETNRWSWWHLRLQVFGVRLDFQHHPSTRGSLPWTRPQAAQRLAFRIWSEHQLRGLEFPHYAFRSHLHVHSDSGSAYPTRAIVTPAWQAKTAHAHKVASDSIADMGGCYVLVEPNGQHSLTDVLYAPELPQVWSPNAA